VFLSSDRQEYRRSPQLFDLPPVFWKGEFKLPNECDQKRVHFDDAVAGKEQVISFDSFLFDRKAKYGGLRESPSDATPGTSREGRAIPGDLNPLYRRRI